MENLTSYFNRRASSCVNAEANWGPRSEIRVSWRPKHLNTLSKKSWAILAASMVLRQGARITPLVRPWLTTTKIESKVEEGERSVMRSTESCLNRRGEVDDIGQRGGVVGWVLTLFC